LLGPSSSRLNWDDIFEVLQRTPNLELKFWYGGNDSRYRLKKDLKLFGIPLAIITHLK
jgi:hypothetical protein